MTKETYYMYKQAEGAPGSNLGLLGVLRKLLSRKKAQEPQPVPPPTPQEQLPPLPADAWHCGGIGM